MSGVRDLLNTSTDSLELQVHTLIYVSWQIQFFEQKKFNVFPEREAVGSEFEEDLDNVIYVNIDADFPWY